MRLEASDSGFVERCEDGEARAQLAHAKRAQPAVQGLIVQRRHGWTRAHCASQLSQLLQSGVCLNALPFLWMQHLQLVPSVFGATSARAHDVHRREETNSCKRQWVRSGKAESRCCGEE